MSKIDAYLSPPNTLARPQPGRCRAYGPPGERKAEIVSPPGAVEDIAAFRLRARQWLAQHMPRLPDGVDNQSLLEDDEYGLRARALQRLLHDAGFAGLCFPVEYGGRG